MESNKSWPVSPKREGQRFVRLKPINRQQLLLRPVEVEKLVEEDHPVRAIWELVGQLNLEPFYAEIESVEGIAGRPGWDPQLLISLWLTAYKDGVNSAREIARLCEYHPAYQWLTGLQVVNYHTLADFRIAHQQALDQLFIEVLGVLSHEGLITLQRVMHDGTKVKACASAKSFHRKATLEDHLRLAREQVEQMGDPGSEELSQRVAKARQRALRERQERLDKAIRSLDQMKPSRSEAPEKKETRASSTDPEARVMQGAQGAYGPSYNMQISTDAEAKIIVGVGVTQSAADAAELEPAVERIEAHLGEKPKQVVVDGGFTNQATIEAMQVKQIELIGALPERREVAERRMKQRGVSPEFYPQAFAYDAVTDCCRCPGGKVLINKTKEQQRASVRYRYRAKPADCRQCAFQARCCPGTKAGRSWVRSEARPEVVAFQTKMETPGAQAIYKQRAAVAEFPNAWIKDKMRLRQFRLRGLAKVTLEALWACLTYNVSQWIRLCWNPRRLAQA